MYIPPPGASFDAPSLYSLGGVWSLGKHGSDENNGDPTRNWSSFIGIVTAICGNILISFALNTQRYAHMRLSRDREEREEKQRRARKRRRKNNSYGTQPDWIAEERSRANADGEPREYTYKEPEESAETDALIPSVDSLDSRKFSRSSEETVRDGGDGEDAPQQKNYLRSPIWWAGITMMTLGEAGNFLAYGFAPASIVSPLGVVALISNCLIAPLLLHERFRWRDGLGVVVAVAGCVTVVMSASSSNPKLDPDAIWHLITRWEFETYLGITIVVILALCVASNKFGDRSILIDLGLMALFGGYTALATKGVASLLSTSIWKVVTFPITYLLVAVLIFTAVMQIKYINRALQRFSATIVVPTQFVLFTLSVIMGSAILYRDFERTTTEQAIKFVGGCALTFLGVWFITSGRNDHAEGDEDELDEEDAINLVDEEGFQPEIREREELLDRRPSLIAGSPSKDAPQLQRYHSADDIESQKPIIDRDAPEDGLARVSVDGKPAEIPPAVASAIHAQPTAPSPRPESPQGAGSRQPPPMHATTSEPVVPTIKPSSSLRPETPLKRGISDIADSPTKPTPSTPTPRHPPGVQPHPDPNSSQKLLNRHSVVGLLPGPLSTPLSSSLSAIVADSLRRGVDHTPSPPGRRRSIKLLRRRGLDGSQRLAANAAPLKRHSIASGEMDWGDEANGEDGRRASVAIPEASGAGEGGRMRSLSATLGDLFGSGSSSQQQKRRKVESRESVQEQRTEDQEGGEPPAEGR